MVDLHVHSIYSDGTNTPEELVSLAATRGLSAMALTDHDTVGGIRELIAAAANSTVEAVPGIREVALFGASLHAVADTDPNRTQEVKDALHQVGHIVDRIGPITPSLEDVFVSLIEERDRQLEPVEDVKR